MSPVPKTIMIVLGTAPLSGGTVGSSLGIAVRLRVRRIARRKAADSPFESGSSFEYMSIMKAELTAEKRPA